MTEEPVLGAVKVKRGRLEVSMAFSPKDCLLLGSHHVPLKLHCLLGGELETRTLGFVSPTWTASGTANWNVSSTSVRMRPLCFHALFPATIIHYCEWLGNPIIPPKGYWIVPITSKALTRALHASLMLPHSWGDIFHHLPNLQRKQVEWETQQAFKASPALQRGSLSLCDVPLTSFDPAIPFPRIPSWHKEPRGVHTDIWTKIFRLASRKKLETMQMGSG